MKLRRLNENLEKSEVISWLRENVVTYIKEDQIDVIEGEVKINSRVSFKIKTIPDFKFSEINGDVRLFNSENLTDFSWMPREIKGDFIITNCSISDFKGFPNKIEGLFEVVDCKGFKSFNGLKLHVEQSITFYNLPDLEFLDCYNVTFSKGGLLIKECPIKILEGLPKMINSNKCPWINIRKALIKDLVGLPSCVGYLYISNCANLESIEGIPFVVKNEEHNSASDAIVIQSRNEKVTKGYEIYLDTLQKYPPEKEETRSQYISRVYKDVPEMSIFLTKEEIPTDFSGARLIKRLGGF